MSVNDSVALQAQWLAAKDDQIRTLTERVRVLEEALLDAFAVIDGEIVDLSPCSYFNGTGICGGGCRDEPECQTCEPPGGWPLVRARKALPGGEG